MLAVAKIYLHDVSYESCGLWQRALAERANDPHEQPRTRLRVAQRQLRENVSQIATEIARNLPEFTVHDTSDSRPWIGACGVPRGEKHLTK